MAEDHEGWAGGDVGHLAWLLVGLGVDVDKDYVTVIFALGVGGWREGFAGATPVGPPVENHDLVALDGLLEVL